MSEEKSDHKSTGKQPSASTQLAGVEKWAYDTFNTNNPVKLPEGARKWIAENAWWLAAVVGVLTLIGAYQMWYLVNYSALSHDLRAIGLQGAVVSGGLWWYILLGITVLEGVALLVAVPKLKAMQKAGWNLLFYLSLLGIALGIVSVLTPGYGVGSLIGAAIGVAISWTILMQIRDRFKS